MTDHLVDVGGYRLDVRITGTGSPAVVCLASLGGAFSEWAPFVPVMSEHTTVVTYARPGLEGSDRLPIGEDDIPRTGMWAAEQLRTLLRNTGVKPPYVLLSGSIGAFIADQYAVAWPDEVAGLVLDDPTGPRRFAKLEGGQPIYGMRNEDLPDAEPGGILFSRALLHSFLEEPAPENRDGRFVVVSSAVGRWLRNEPQEWHQPLTLAEVDAQWVLMQAEWAERLRAVHLVADTAGHHIAREEPHLAATVVRAVVEAARENRSVEIDAASLAAVGGHLAQKRAPDQ